MISSPDSEDAVRHHRCQEATQVDQDAARNLE